MERNKLFDVLTEISEITNYCNKNKSIFTPENYKIINEYNHNKFEFGNIDYYREESNYILSKCPTCQDFKIVCICESQLTKYDYCINITQILCYDTNDISNYLNILKHILKEFKFKLNIE